MQAELENMNNMILNYNISNNYQERIMHNNMEACDYIHYEPSQCFYELQNVVPSCLFSSNEAVESNSQAKEYNFECNSTNFSSVNNIETTELSKFEDSQKYVNTEKDKSINNFTEIS